MSSLLAFDQGAHLDLNRVLRVSTSDEHAQNVDMADVRHSLELLQRKHAMKRRAARKEAAIHPPPAVEITPPSMAVPASSPQSSFARNRPSPSAAAAVSRHDDFPHPIPSLSSPTSTRSRRIQGYDLSNPEVVNQMTRSTVKRLHDSLREQILHEMQVELEPEQRFDEVVKQGFEELEAQKRGEGSMPSQSLALGPRHHSLHTDPSSSLSPSSLSNLKSPSTSLRPASRSSSIPSQSPSPSSQQQQQQQHSTSKPRHLSVNVGALGDLMSPPLSVHPASRRSTPSKSSSRSEIVTPVSAPKSSPSHVALLLSARAARLDSAAAAVGGLDLQGQESAQQLAEHPEVKLLSELLSPKSANSGASGSPVSPDGVTGFGKPPLSAPRPISGSSSSGPSVHHLSRPGSRDLSIPLNRARSPAHGSVMDALRPSGSGGITASHQLVRAPSLSSSPPLASGSFVPNASPSPTAASGYPPVHTPGSAKRRGCKPPVSPVPTTPSHQQLLAGAFPTAVAGQPQPQLMYAVPVGADPSTPQGQGGYFYAIPALPGSSAVPFSPSFYLSPVTTQQQGALASSSSTFNFDVSRRPQVHQQQQFADRLPNISPSPSSRTPSSSAAAGGLFSPKSASHPSAIALTPSSLSRSGHSPVPPSTRPHSESLLRRPVAPFLSASPPEVARSKTAGSVQVGGTPTSTSAVRMRRMREAGGGGSPSSSGSSATPQPPSALTPSSPYMQQLQLSAQLAAQQYPSLSASPQPLQLGNWTTANGSAPHPIPMILVPAPSPSPQHLASSNKPAATQRSANKTAASASPPAGTASTHRPLRSQTRHATASSKATAASVSVITASLPSALTNSPSSCVSSASGPVKSSDSVSEKGKYHAHRNSLLQARTRGRQAGKGEKSTGAATSTKAKDKAAPPRLNLQQISPAASSVIQQQNMVAIAEGDESAAALLSARMAELGGGSSSNGSGRGGSTIFSSPALHSSSSSSSAASAAVLSSSPEIEEDPSLAGLGLEHQMIPLPPNGLRSVESDEYSDTPISPIEEEEHLRSRPAW